MMDCVAVLHVSDILESQRSLRKVIDGEQKFVTFGILAGLRHMGGKVLALALVNGLYFLNLLHSLLKCRFIVDFDFFFIDPDFW